MAWNPNVPTVTNRVQDDLDAIRQNFQVLDGHLADTNNPHNVQAQQVPYGSGVVGFSPADVKAALDALAGVRIVEMGSNSNGEYVRWENGLQVCFVHRVAFVGDGTSDEKTGYWGHPAAFASPPAIVGRNAQNQAPPRWYLEVNPDVGTGITNVFWHAYRTSGVWSSGTNFRLHYIAIGRWK